MDKRVLNMSEKNTACHCEKLDIMALRKTNILAELSTFEICIEFFF